MRKLTTLFGLVLCIIPILTVSCGGDETKSVFSAEPREVSLGYDGADEAKVTVLTENISGWIVSVAEADKSWLMAEKSENLVIITAKRNYDGKRQGTVTLIANEKVSDITITVTQNADPEWKEGSFGGSCKTAWALNYGDYWGNGTAVMQLNLYVAETLDEVGMPIPPYRMLRIESYGEINYEYALTEGEYKLGAGISGRNPKKNTFEAGVMDEGIPYYTTFFDYDENGEIVDYGLVDGGTFSITLDGNDYVITTDLTGEWRNDREPVDVTFNYRGKLMMYDKSDDLKSSLTEPIYVTSFSSGSQTGFGESYDRQANEYAIELASSGLSIEKYTDPATGKEVGKYIGTGYLFCMTMHTEMRHTTGIPGGGYTVADNSYNPGTILKGENRDWAFLLGSYVVKVVDGRSRETGFIGSGSCLVTKSDGNYKLDINLKDDTGIEIKGLYEGPLEFSAGQKK